MDSNNDLDSLSYSEDEDDDKELEIAFRKGLLKPGLNQEIAETQKININNVQQLKKKLEDFKLNLPWVERLDLTCEPAPMAPELALQLNAHKNKTYSNALNDDLVYDDFAREMEFYRLGQQAVLVGLPKLRSLGIPTKRPDDYLAEMTKSDDHMHKIRKRLKHREITAVNTEKVKKLREMKKYGKQVQVQRELEKKKEKREMLEEIKKYRKGKTNTLAFLDSEPQKFDAHGLKNSKKRNREEMEGSNDKQSNKKFGNSGTRKKGWKRTTKSELSGPLDSSGFHINRQNKNKNKKNTKGKNRPGKISRQKMNANKGSKNTTKERKNTNKGSKRR